MCIWKVNDVDRLCGYCSYEGGCEERDFAGILARDERARLYVSTMSRLCGCDILFPVRHQQMVWARNIVAHRMRREGYTLRAIAEAIAKNHATVVYASKQVEKMLERPKMYPEEYELWRNFNKEIDLQDNKDYVGENSEMVVLPGSESGGAQG